MVKEIILIILLFNGEAKLVSFPFEGTIHECFEYGNKLRIELAIYNEERNAWFLNDGPRPWQGYICE